MSDPAPDPSPPHLANYERSIAALYDRFGGQLYRVALAMLRQREDAEDAVQEVFSGLVRSRRKLDDVGNLQSYLFVSLRHAAERIGRRRAKAPASCRAVAEQAAPPDPPPGGQANERLAHALEALPAEQREVISLKIDGQLTFSQIAAVIGVSANTAASRYRYALEKLRRSLQQ